MDKENKEIRYDLTEVQRTTRKKNKIYKANIAEYRESLQSSIKQNEIEPNDKRDHARDEKHMKIHYFIPLK